MNQYFDRFGTLRERPSKADIMEIADLTTVSCNHDTIAHGGTISPTGMGLMMKAMLAKSKGNIRICTDMTKDEGVVIRRTSKLEHKCLDIILEEEDGD